MKIFLILGLSAAVFFVWQRESDNPAPIATAAPPTSAAATATPVTRPVSAHNWAKHSLDRTHEVMDQVQQSREQNEQR